MVRIDAHRTWLGLRQGQVSSGTIENVLAGARIPLRIRHPQPESPGKHVLLPLSLACDVRHCLYAKPLPGGEAFGSHQKTT